MAVRDEDPAGRAKDTMNPDDSELDNSFLYELARDGRTSDLVAHMKRAQRPVVRRRAAEILGDFANVSRPVDRDEIVRELIAVILEENDDSVRARAIDSLFRHGREPLERLVTTMADFDASETPDWVTTGQLVEWLDDDYPEFRVVAAAALGEIGDEHAVSHLVNAFDDLDPRVRERAVRACGAIGDERAIGPIRERLDDSDPRVQRAAANALAGIGNERALSLLIPAARADDEGVRRIAVSELGRFESINPLPVLGRALEDSDERVRRTAVLSHIELLAGDADPTGAVQRAVIDQLRQADSAVLIPQLVDILSESSRLTVRRHVVRLLGRTVDSDSERVEPVHEALLEVLGEPGLGPLAGDSLVRLESEELEHRIRIFTKSEEGSPEAIERAEAVLEEIGTVGASEVVRNAVDYTYVKEPADYTRAKRDGDG